MHVIGLVFIAIIAGIAGIGALWSYGPVLAILCALFVDSLAIVCTPLVASSVTALCAVLMTFRRPRRHGLPVAAAHYQ